MEKNQKVHFTIYTILAFIPLLAYFLPSVATKYIFTESIMNILSYFPYATFSLIAFAGFKLNQTRIIAISMFLICGFYLTINYNTFVGLGIGRIRIHQILTMTTPLSLFFIFIIKESELLHKKTILRITLAILPILILAIIFIQSPKAFVTISEYDFFNLKSNYKFPLISVIPILLFLFSIILSKDKKTKQFMIATFISLIPFLTTVQVALNFKGATLTGHTFLSYTIISMILIHAIFHMYWHRVYIDELTEIQNRRALDERLAMVPKDYSFAMIDIDHFKLFNDNYGHDEGDNVLRIVAKTMNENSKYQVYRYGGEEFSVIFKDLDADEAKMYANKIRKKVENIPFYIRKETPERRGESPKEQKKEMESVREKVSIRISIGVACSKGKDQPPTQVIKHADEALYKAKESGRNCVVAYNEKKSK